MTFAGLEYDTRNIGRWTCCLTGETENDSVAVFGPDGNVLFSLTSEMDVKITISMNLNQLNLTAMPIAFATQAIRMASGSDASRRAVDRCRRCANVALTGGCWVDIVSLVPQLQMLKLSRFCFPFSAAAENATPETDPFVLRLVSFFLKACRKSDVSEVAVRGLFWDPLIAHLLDIPTLGGSWAVCEFELGKLFASERRRFIDMALQSETFRMPIFMAEMASDAVPTGYLHKDFSKLAMSMSLSCRETCKYLHHQGKDFTKVRVYGAWIGGSQISFCVAYPHLETIADRCHFSVLLTAPEHWRFDLFQAPELCSESCCCNVLEGEVPMEPASSDEHAVGAEVSAEDLDTYIYGGYLDPKTLLDKDKYEYPKVKTGKRRMARSVNPESMACIRQVFTSIRRYAEDIQQQLADRSSKYPSSDSGTGTESSCTSDTGLLPQHLRPRKIFWPSGENFIQQPQPRHLLSTPRKTRTHSQSSLIPNYLKMFRFRHDDRGFNSPAVEADDYGQVHFIMRKRKGKRELELYERFHGLFIFPVLFDYLLRKDGTCVFDFEYLEQVDTRLVHEYSFICNDDSTLHTILEAATCTIHLLCGLWFLHERFKIVHSDICPSNVMYSVKDELWKLIDYDQAMSIEESLEKPREAGTHGYIAPEAKSSGVFTPASDVYSLGKTLYALWFGHLHMSLTFGTDEEGAEELYARFATIVWKATFADTAAARPSVTEMIREFYHEYAAVAANYPEFRFKSADKIFPLIRHILKDDLPRVFEPFSMAEMKVVPVETPAVAADVDMEDGKENLIPEVPSVDDQQRKVRFKL